MNTGTGKAPTIAEERAFMIYDAESGEVRHLHRVTVFTGAEAPPREEDDARALAAARQLGHRTEKLAVLSIAPADLAASAGCRVDLRSRKLVKKKMEPDARSRS